MKKFKFTYLLGAGASANTIPTVDKFAHELYEFAKYLDDFKIQQDLYHDLINKGLNPTEVKNDFVEAIKWLADECARHSSVDTFARKLYLANRLAELHKLKIIISEFILVYQARKGIDIRYDAFFAALLEKSASQKLIIPENIRIISWNYDKQIEFSIAQFLDRHETDYVEDFLQVFPRKNLALKISDSFCLFKLNGTIGGTILEGNEFKPMIFDYKVTGSTLTKEIEKGIIRNIIRRFQDVKDGFSQLEYSQKFNQGIYPTIMYSWEQNSIIELVRSKALERTKDTDILIIIGYSFPVFNRKLDKLILKNMVNLKKVFIQSPEASINGVVQRFKSLYEFSPKIEIIPITNVEEFYIPFEY